MESNVVAVEVFQGENGEWYWRAKGGNGEIVANSAPESYTRHEDALTAVNATFPGVEAQSVSTTFNEAQDDEQPEAEAPENKVEAHEDATSE